MRFDLTGGWHLLRVEIRDTHEWIICDPIGDRLGGTPKHKAELDVALIAGTAEIERLRSALEEVLKMSADVPSEDGGELLEALCKRALGNEQGVAGEAK